ncbi:hypothetical protein BH10PSE12_BH10PSE12_20980 [soil metagenome]
MLRYLLPLVLLSACSATDKKQDTAATAAGPAVIPLFISQDGKAHRFDVEVALTPEQQAKGLMFRKTLAADAGMVFPMAPPRIASFWMKDTFIPLDMLFVRTDGTVAFVAANVQPYSRIPVSAGIPVAGVVELRGGRAAELGIDEGARIRWGDCARPAAPDRPSAGSDFCPAN